MCLLRWLQGIELCLSNRLKWFTRVAVRTRLWVALTILCGFQILVPELQVADLEIGYSFMLADVAAAC